MGAGSKPWSFGKPLYAHFRAISRALFPEIVSVSDCSVRLPGSEALLSLSVFIPGVRTLIAVLGF